MTKFVAMDRDRWTGVGKSMKPGYAIDDALERCHLVVQLEYRVVSTFVDCAFHCGSISRH